MPRSDRFVRCGCTCLMALAFGCGPARPARLEQPRFDVAAVIASVDANGDGTIDAAEQARVPGIAAAAKGLDVDADGSLSVKDLVHWLEEVRTSRVAITSFSAMVTQAGKPLRNVTVRLIPEPFMGTEIKVAEGVTDAAGNVVLTIPNSPYAGVNCGIYRAEFTGNGMNGEPLPPRFNTASEVGVLIGGPFPENGIATFSLD